MTEIYTHVINTDIDKLVSPLYGFWEFGYKAEGGKTENRKAENRKPERGTWGWAYVLISEFQYFVV